MDYSDFCLTNTPKTVAYIPNFITSAEEENILNNVYTAPKPKWTQLTRRRLLNYGGIPHKNGMIAESLPEWLQKYVEKINYLGIFHTNKANHVLINEYLSGQGIMAHTDGPLFYPTISTISCGSHTVLEFLKQSENESNKEYKCILSDYAEAVNEKSKKPIFKLLLEPRSLLILKNEMYTDYLHKIKEIEEDVIDDMIANLKNCGNIYNIGSRLKRSARISLTVRHVPKTTKFKLF